MALTPAQLELVAQCFLFRELPAGVLPELTRELTAESCPAGAVIYSRTSFRRAMGLVLAGRLAVLKGRDLLLNTLGPGQCFGVAALFCPEEDYVTTVRAQTPAELVFFPDRWLTDLFRQYPQTSVAYIAFLSQRIRFLNRKIDSFTAPSTQETLWRHLEASQRQGLVPVPGGYSQLARSLNMGRASLYRALDALEAAGRIRRESGGIRLLAAEDSPDNLPSQDKGDIER